MEIRCAYRELLSPNSLKPHPANPNEHGQDQIDLFVEILKYQGWRRPITVSIRSGYITKGHGALAAALAAGCDKVPVDYQDYVDEAQELADIVADNQLARMSQMNVGKLQKIVGQLETMSVNLELTGFTVQQIQPFMVRPEIHHPGMPNQVHESSQTYESAKNDMESPRIQPEKVGAREYTEEQFQNFAHQCPRCKFEFD